MASRRKSTEPPPIEIKYFTLEEIALGVTKLKRRIEDVTRLATDKVSHDDQRRKNVEQEIVITILEIFGHNSPEYRKYQHHSIWHGEMVASAFGEETDYQ